MSDFINIFSEESRAIAYLVENNVFIRPDECIACSGEGISIRGKSWRCTRKDCRKSWSIFSGSFFSQCKIDINKILALAYFWLCGVKSTQLILITGLSKPTISMYTKSLRRLVGDDLDYIDLQIGGPGIVVEIDECKMGKNKYHRGHHVSGAWVLGGVERTLERKLFLIEVPNRTEETLIRVIRTHVLPGSIIITDCFRSYWNLEQYYTHLTVNHSQNFVDPTTGACTNTIEGTWAALKYKISPRNRTNSIDENGEITEHLLDDFLSEFQWRRKNMNNLWIGFMHALQEVRYID